MAVAGFKTATVADTICDQSVEWALPGQPVDPPTLAMTFSVNDSPLAGKEGDKVTTRMIRARLMREGEGNVAIRVSDTENADSYEVAGRGELQLGVLIETMRREGFELAVGRHLGRDDLPFDEGGRLGGVVAEHDPVQGRRRHQHHHETGAEHQLRRPSSQLRRHVRPLWLNCQLSP